MYVFSFFIFSTFRIIIYSGPISAAHHEVCLLFRIVNIPELIFCFV